MPATFEQEPPPRAAALLENPHRVSNGADPERMKAYADWFFAEHLIYHFELEERHVFPVLGGNGRPLVKQALLEHGRLKQHFTATKDLAQSLRLIGEELMAHIRYEERVLFPELQAVATPEQLADIKRLHDVQPFLEEWDDLFGE